MSGLNKTISILGCGWLGLPLAQQLVSLSYSVKGSTTTPEKIPLLEKSNIAPFVICLDPSGQIIWASDISDFFRADVLFLNVPFRRDFVDPLLYQKQIDAVISQVEASSVKFVIFTSSTSVYPDALADSWEDVSFIPDNPRSQVLKNIEDILLRHPGFQTTVLRLAGLYGPGRPIGKFLAGKKDIPGGNSPVNLIHQEDVIAVITQIIRQDIRGEIFNVVSDRHPTKKELYTRSAQKMGLPLPRFLEEQDLLPGKIVSNQKFKNRLGYVLKHPNPLEDI